MGRRVVSLLPSTTETVAALGHGAALVGRSHECDFPPGVLDLPVVSRPRREPVGTSRETHRGVVDLLEQVLSIYEVDPEALRAAEPDLIITQDLCRVCAVAEDEVVAAARAYLDEAVEVLTSSPMTLAEVFGDVRRIGEALDDRTAAERLVARMRTVGRSGPGGKMGGDLGRASATDLQVLDLVPAMLELERKEVVGILHGRRSRSGAEFRHERIVTEGVDILHDPLWPDDPLGTWKDPENFKPAVTTKAEATKKKKRLLWVIPRGGGQPGAAPAGASEQKPPAQVPKQATP